MTTASARVEIKKASSYHELTIYCQFRLQIVTMPASRPAKLRAANCAPAIYALRITPFVPDRSLCRRNWPRTADHWLLWRPKRASGIRRDGIESRRSGLRGQVGRPCHGREHAGDRRCGLAGRLATFSPRVGERLAKHEIAPDRLALEERPEVRKQGRIAEPCCGWR